MQVWREAKGFFTRNQTRMTEEVAEDFASYCVAKLLEKGTLSMWHFEVWNFYKDRKNARYDFIHNYAPYDHAIPEDPEWCDFDSLLTSVERKRALVDLDAHLAPTQRCSKCKQAKARWAFSPSQTRCKPCRTTRRPK